MGEHVAYLLNYSSEEVRLDSPYEGHLLVSGGQSDAQAHVGQGQPLTIGPWDLAIIVK